MTGGHVVGALDIGGTHVSAARVDIASAAVDPRSRISERLPTRGGRPELVAAVSRVTRSIAESGIAVLGVAVPGPFDYSTGVSEMTHKLAGLRGVDLRSELLAASELHDPAAIRFLNDAEAFLLGEWWAGAARGHGRAVGVTLGTGLGSAFGVEGELVRSGDVVPPHGELYRLSFRGAPVEETISRAALLGAYGARPEEDVDVEQVAERAAAGKGDARRVFEDLGIALGQFLTPWVQAFRPGCVVVGGSIARSWALFGDVLRSELAQASDVATVTVAEQIEDAPLLGAAFYAADRR